MANDFGEAIQKRANPANVPIVTMVATVEGDLNRNEAERTLASIRPEIMAGSDFAQNVTQDYTVNSFGVRTLSSITWEDAREVRSMLRNELRDQGYAVEAVSIQADIEQDTL